MPRVFPNTNPACPDDIREAGWVVAVHNDYRVGGWVVGVHNDYRVGGVPHTFWLFTKDDAKDRPEPGEGRYAKGEGESDAVALNRVRSMIGLPILPPVAGEYTATYCDGPHTPPNCPHCVRLDGSPAYPVREGMSSPAWRAANLLAGAIGREVQDLPTADAVAVYEHLVHALTAAIEVERTPPHQPKK